MVDQKALFRPRKSEKSGASAAETAQFQPNQFGAKDLHSTRANGIVELTKNSKYCVSKLPASPGILSTATTQAPDGILNGYVDHLSNYSLVINNNTITVWSYKSTDATPLSIQFPVQENTQSGFQNGSPLPPLAILTKPINRNTDDPGLMIIDSSSGHVKFYESVQHAPALGLINNKLLELTIPLNSSQGEYITLAENVEPAGIVVATSLKRCVLIGFKDFFSKPRLSLTELLPPALSRSLGLLSKIFSVNSSLEAYANDSGDEVVSIKTSRVLDQGMTQDIFIQDSRGAYYFFTLQLVSPDTGAMVDRKLSFKQHISVSIESNIEGYNLPGSSNKINILDLWPLQQDGADLLKDVHLALCEIEPSLGSDNARSEYVLVTLKINRTGVLYYGTHKLNKSFNIPSVKPRLFLPKPGKVAFVTVGNSVILTDVNLSYIESNSSPYYYNQRRWEDIIRLKPSVQIVGQGYEDESVDSNSSIVLLTTNSGVLRVEKFPPTTESDMDVDIGSDQNLADPVSTIKSHIEQGTFFAKSSDEVDFDLLDAASYSLEAIQEAVAQTIDSILNSTSPYLPVFLPSIKDFLNLKISLFQTLISFVKRNFPDVWTVLVSRIVGELEKTSMGLQLWTFVQANEGKVQNILKKIIQKYAVGSNPEAVADPLRYFLNHKLQFVNQVLNEFVVTLVKENVSLSVVNDLLVSTLYYGVFEFEKQYILQENDIASRRIWIFDTDLIINVEEIFRNIYCTTSNDIGISSEKFKTNNSQLCEVLYYFVTSAVQYMQHFELGKQQQLKDYLKWYNNSKIHWIKSLLSRGLEDDAIKICETYHDYSSLVVVLESEAGRPNQAYYEYFDLFGYDFAFSLYDYYLSNDKINALLLNFESYRPFLRKYFQENPKKTCQISWIRDFLDGDFSTGSNTLRLSSAEQADESIDNKELKFSLAKLSAIAAASSQPRASTNDYDMLVDTEESLVVDSNNNLVLIRIQNKLYNELLKSIVGINVEGEDLINLNYVSKHFRNELIDLAQFKALVEEPLGRLSSRKMLTPIQLVDLLTFLKPTINSGKNFAYALRVTSLIINDSIYREQCRLVWLRLLTLTDKWTELTLTVNETDESTKLKFTNSTLFRTFQKIGTDNDLVQQLDVVLTADQSSIDSDDPLTRELLSKLSVYKRENNLVSWIKSIKLEVGSA